MQKGSEVVTKSIYTKLQLLFGLGVLTVRRTDLVFLNGFINAQTYIQQILQPIVLPFAGAVGSHFLLNNDNARLHTAVAVRNWIEQDSIEVLP